MAHSSTRQYRTEYSYNTMCGTIYRRVCSTACCTISSTAKASSSTHCITTDSSEVGLQADSQIVYSSKLRLASRTHIQLNMLGMHTWL
jgi:hypothetical protein